MFWLKKKSEDRLINVGKIKFTAYLDTSSEVRNGEVCGKVARAGYGISARRYSADKVFHEILQKWHESGFARFGDEYVPVKRISRIVVSSREDYEVVS